MSLPENFAEHPKSIGEIRSDRESSASAWTPRDALISALRDIDSGIINADAVVICIREVTGENDVSTTYLASSPDAHLCYGLLMSTLFKIRETP